MAKRKSVITITIKDVIYYAMDNRGNTWSDEINDSRQSYGMAKTKHRKMKEYLEDLVQADPNRTAQIHIKINGNFSWNTTDISYAEVNTVELHELYLSI